MLLPSKGVGGDSVTLVCAVWFIFDSLFSLFERPFYCWFYRCSLYFYLPVFTIVTWKVKKSKTESFVTCSTWWSGWLWLATVRDVLLELCICYVEMLATSPGTWTIGSRSSNWPLGNLHIGVQTDNPSIRTATTVGNEAAAFHGTQTSICTLPLTWRVYVELYNAKVTTALRRSYATW